MKTIRLFAIALFAALGQLCSFDALFVGVGPLYRRMRGAFYTAMCAQYGIRPIAGGSGVTTTSRVTGISGGYPTPTDWTAQPRYVDDELQNMSPLDVPFLKYCGGISQFTATNPKIEWVEDDLWQARLTTSSTTAFTDTAQTTLFLSGNTAYQLHTGLVVQIDDELMWVTGVTGDAKATVTRDYAGSTAATHATASSVYLMGISAPENADSNYRGSAIFAFPYNYAQIFDVAYQVSERQNNTEVYGRNGADLDKMTADTLKQLMVLLEEACFRGLRGAGSSATEPASMGGLREFLNSTDSNVTDLATAAITEKDINDLLQTMFYAVGPQNMAKTIICGPWVKRKISSFYEPHYRSTVESKRGGVTIEQITTDFGTVDVLMHYHCPPERMYFVNPEYIEIGHYKGGQFADAPLAIAGPYYRRHVYGDYSMKVKNVKSMGLIDNVSITT